MLIINKPIIIISDECEEVLFLTNNIPNDKMIKPIIISIIYIIMKKIH